MVLKSNENLFHEGFHYVKFDLISCQMSHFMVESFNLISFFYKNWIILHENQRVIFNHLYYHYWIINFHIIHSCSVKIRFNLKLNTTNSSKMFPNFLFNLMGICCIILNHYWIFLIHFLIFFISLFILNYLLFIQYILEVN